MTTTRYRSKATMTLRTAILAALRDGAAGVDDITSRIRRAGIETSNFEVHTWLKRLENAGAVYSWRSEPATSSMRRGGVAEGGLFTYDAIERV